jgi:hypothetical protein
MTPPQIVGAALVLGFTLIDELGPHIRKKPDNRNMQDTKE